MPIPMFKKTKPIFVRIIRDIRKNIRDIISTILRIVFTPKYTLFIESL